MTPPSYITSPSGVFAFGFRALDASNPGKFLLATWFRSQDDDDGDGQASSSSQLQSVVWFAKNLSSSSASSASLATAQSVLSVTAGGQLELKADTGNRVLWRAPVIPNLARGSLLVILDSGNLQFLADGGSQGNVLWESFAHPRDTLLPGQSLAINAQSYWKLISKRADTEFTTGRFTMGIQTDGNVVLYVDLLSGNSPDNAYWQANTDTRDGNTTVTLDEQGALNYTVHNGTVGSLISPMAADTAGKFYKFARMDPDGLVRVYVRSKNGGGNTTSWSISGAFPSDGGCNKRTSRLQGLCGPGSYCTEQKEDRLRCLCPAGYTYADAQHTDSGCTPEFVPQSCDGENNTDEYTLVDLLNTTWETSNYYKKFSAVTEDQCRDYCLNDCYCVAVLMISGTDCTEVGVAALTNGRQASDVTTKALIKIRRSNRPAARTRTARTIVAVTVCVAFVLLAVAGGFLAKHYLARKNGEWEIECGPPSFTYKDLAIATRSFNDRMVLGKGGFGKVYKGVLQTSKQNVAIKRVSLESKQGMKEFIAEITILGHPRHRNLVKLLGYSRHKNELLLVYDYMPNGSLDRVLHGQDSQVLDWVYRLNIIKGISSGLFYLHEDWEKVVIHRDIKTSNVLLDSEMNARLGDFGLARLHNHGTDAHTTRLAGTWGYIAPELARLGRATKETDVFAFGVVMLEVACGRRPIEVNNSGEPVLLTDWVLHAWESGSVLMTVDPRLEDYIREEVELVLKLGLLCSHSVPSSRPCMRLVKQYLEKDAPLPDFQPCFFSITNRDEGVDQYIISSPSVATGTTGLSGGR